MLPKFKLHLAILTVITIIGFISFSSIRLAELKTSVLGIFQSAQLETSNDFSTEPENLTAIIQVRR